MVGVHQPAVGGDNAVAVGVGVVPGGDVVGGPALGVGRHRGAQRGHGVGGGAVHADLAVPVQGHEVPGRVHLGVDHRELQAVALTDRAPVVHRGAAQWVGPDAHAGLADRLEVDDALQVVDVGLQVVVLDDVGAVERLGDRDPRDVLPPGGEQLVGAIGDPRGGLRAGRAAGGRVVLEAAVARRVVGGGHHDAVGQAGPARAHPRLGPGTVGQEDGVRDRRGGRVGATGVDGGGHPGTGEHLDGGAPGGLGQGVRVTAQVEGAVGALGAAVLHDGGGRGHDVGLVEGGVQRGAAVPGGTEDDLLSRDGGVGDEVVVGGDDLVDVDEVFGLCWLSCACVHGHSVSRATGRISPFRCAKQRPLRGRDAVAGELGMAPDDGVVGGLAVRTREGSLEGSERIAAQKDQFSPTP